MSRKKAPTMRATTSTATPVPAISSIDSPWRSPSNRGLATLFRMAKDEIVATKQPASQASTRLRVSEPGGAHEREADAVAERIMRTDVSDRSGHYSQAPAERSLQAKCAQCDREGTIGWLATGPGAGLAPAIVGDALQSQGQPLDPATRAFFEPRFSQDLDMYFSGLTRRMARWLAHRPWHGELRSLSSWEMAFWYAISLLRVVCLACIP